jgi:hypothetical protein
MAEMMEALARFRWFYSKGRHYHPPVLQQAWRSQSTGELSWQDVPTVYEDPADAPTMADAYEEKAHG